jgi:hypothetical protein
VPLYSFFPGSPDEKRTTSSVYLSSLFSLFSCSRSGRLFSVLLLSSLSIDIEKKDGEREEQKKRSMVTDCHFKIKKENNEEGKKKRN